MCPNNNSQPHHKKCTMRLWFCGFSRTFWCAELLCFVSHWVNSFTNLAPQFLNQKWWVFHFIRTLIGVQILEYDFNFYSNFIRWFLSLSLFLSALTRTANCCNNTNTKYDDIDERSIVLRVAMPMTCPREKSPLKSIFSRPIFGAFYFSL